MASLVFNHNSYFAVFSINGTRKWIKIGKVDKKQVKKILKTLEVEYAKDKLHLLEIKQISLYEYIEDYLRYTKANKASSTTRRELDVIKSISSYFGNIPLSNINTQMIESYKAERLENGLKPTGVNRELATIKFLLNKAVNWNYLTSNPAKPVKLLRLPKTPAKFLSTDEIGKLIEHASTWLKPILIVLRNTGVRLHELLNLRWSDLDFKNKRVLIRSSKTNNYRVMPMNQELYQTLLWLRDHYPLPHMDRIVPREDCQKEYIFCMPDGSKLESIKKSFNNACKKAGIKASPHTLRHSFASHLVMSGVDLVSIKELLGHTQISTTMVYARLSPSYKASTVEKLPWNKTKLEVAK
jgi:site-specific recombinase XerD